MKHIRSFIFLTIALLLVLLSGCDSSDYKKAMSLYEGGQYLEAAEIFSALGEYEDSAAMATECTYLQAGSLAESGEYADAIALYETILDHKDSADKLAEAKYALMVQQYGPALEKLTGTEWYYNGGNATTLNQIVFEGAEATISQVEFTGNGRFDNGSSSHSYSMDDKTIYVDLGSKELEIPYQMNDDSFDLGGSDFYTLEEIDAALQGYWKVRSVGEDIWGTLVNYEHNIYIHEGRLVYEHAAPDALGYAGEYYYYGPYEGSYTLNFGGFDTDMFHGSEWFFNILDGVPTILHYYYIGIPSDGLPGQYGYSL